MKIINQARLANWSLSIVLVGAMAIGVFYLARDRDIVHALMHGVRLINEVKFNPPADQLKAGETFRILIKTTQTRSCPFEIRWSLVDDTNEEVLRMVEPPRIRDNTMAVDAVFTEVHEHFIPARIKPGAYRYMAQLFELCKDARAILTTQPAIPVVIH